MKLITRILSQHSSKSHGRERTMSAIVACFLSIPALLGAKGCEVASVGSNEVSCGARLGDTCEADEFCSFALDAICGQADATGVCEPRPEQCSLIFAPVCGCDDKTYENACSANAAGVSVLKNGPCEPAVGNECGGLAGRKCGEGEFCSFPPDATCGAGDQTGTCEVIPEVCPDIYAPVCGCDDKTYSSECSAHGAGVSVARQGECEGGSATCGGLAGLECSKGEFCNYAPEAKCGAGDMTGTCQALPEACDLVYSPVCGCDDKTYSNDCDAHSHGVSVLSTGECDETPTGECKGNKECGDGEYCDLGPACGEKTAGKCIARPEGCTKDYVPVCGCDGKTYGNACSAAAAGVSVSHDGTCEPSPGKACGGLQGLACEKGEFCLFAPEALCGAADATGVCSPVPEVCDARYAPVCGCDGQTYSSECVAHGAGTSVASEGVCEGGQVCGGMVSRACPEGEFCNFPIETKCGSGDQTGTCAMRAEACPEYYEPVCGCDGKTYSNACFATAAGVSVASREACPSEQDVCGGIAGLQCDEGRFCDFPMGTECGSGDQMGTCLVPPEACDDIYEPVCGCDGKTYPNSCEAAAVGMSVLAKGECTPEP